MRAVATVAGRTVSVELAVLAESTRVGCETLRLLLRPCNGVAVEGDQVRLEPWLGEALREGFAGEDLAYTTAGRLVRQGNGPTGPGTSLPVTLLT
jgi:hypothetical protein